MALAIAVAVALITLVSVYVFWAHIWWLPVSISTHGAAVDHQFKLTLLICGVIFVLAQLGLAYVVPSYPSPKSDLQTRLPPPVSSAAAQLSFAA